MRSIPWPVRAAAPILEPMGQTGSCEWAARKPCRFGEKFRRVATWTFIVATLAAAGACAENQQDRKPSRFPYIQHHNFKVEVSSPDMASATGIGCGATEKEALADARKTAHFNLREVTGNANYKIRFKLLREVPKPGRICVEVKASAFDAL